MSGFDSLGTPRKIMDEFEDRDVVVQRYLALVEALIDELEELERDDDEFTHPREITESLREALSEML